MLHYVLIENSEGIDNSDGQDVVRSTNLLSKQCISCHFFTSLQEILNTKKMSVMVAFIV